MTASQLAKDMRVRVGALICVCFLLGSTGWLSWLYRITALADPTQVDFFTMVVGYVAQAAGIGAFMLLSRRLQAEAQSHIAIVSLAAYLLLLEPATMSGNLIVTLAFGWAMNVFCGVTQGYYLTCLAACVEKGRRGVVFGGGYAVSTAMTWLLSVVGGGVATTGVMCLIVCVILAVASVLLVRWVASKRDGGSRAVAQDAAPGAVSVEEDGRLAAGMHVQDDASAQQVEGGIRRGRVSLLVLASATVVLVSLVKNAGFSFPTADLSGVVNLELSRLFYGIGLVIAGIAADRDRKYALACCAVSLAVPFFMLALAGAGATGVILWAIGYLMFGFFAVFRVTLFADLAGQRDASWLAGGGLLFGRMGDVLGTGLLLWLTDAPVALIMVTAVLFVASMWLMFVLYQRFYAPVPPEPQAPSERDVLDEFCMRYGLSTRERQVLPLLVEGKTNAEIAAELFVTESTIKYHMRNIREKTGCKTRLEVVDLYISDKGQ